MATLEDKLLGEKLQYYCDSSDEEDGGGLKLIKEEDIQNNPLTYGKWTGESTNTGPKGVLKDWQRYKQLEAEKRAETEAERLALIKKLSLNCKTREEELAEENQKIEDEINVPELDEIMMEYIAQRMNEMISAAKRDDRPKFGTLQIIKGQDEFLRSIDEEHKETTVFIHIYSPGIKSCDVLNACFNTLAEEYPLYKFCVISTETAGMTSYFEKNGVPALIIYRGGSLIGNFLRLSDEFGEDFVSTDVESFLVEHGFLPDPSTIPKVVRGSRQDNPDDDDD